MGYIGKNISFVFTGRYLQAIYEYTRYSIMWLCYFLISAAVKDSNECIIKYKTIIVSETQADIIYGTSRKYGIQCTVCCVESGGRPLSPPAVSSLLLSYFPHYTSQSDSDSLHEQLFKVDVSVTPHVYFFNYYTN